ncbi:MAG: hypothetical protein ABIT38_01780, partial [Gemmatimonadaceae bacterium]
MMSSLSHPNSSWLAPSIAAAILAVASACRPGDRSVPKASDASAATESMGAAVEVVRDVSSRARLELVEGSAAVMSEQQPGVLFTINDSGHDPYLYAIDTLGADRGAWRVTKARDVDWESLSQGTCGGDKADSSPARDERPVDGDACLYIGDTGDNEATRRSRTIYRVREPVVGDSSFTGVVRAERVDYRYADEAHDVEAMYVAPNGAIRLITKRKLKGPNGTLRPALVFSIDAPAWNRGDTVVAALVDSLPIVPGSAPLRWITDASLTRDGKRLAVRTYVQLYVFETDSATGLVRHDVTPTTCNLEALDEETGEGVSWLPGSDLLVLTREGERTPLLIVRCPSVPTPARR